MKRHRFNENWDDPFSPGALSRFILWNKKTIKESTEHYKNKFNLWMRLNIIFIFVSYLYKQQLKNELNLIKNTYSS